MKSKILFIAGLLFCLTPWASPPIALLVGLVFGAIATHPYPGESRQVSHSSKMSVTIPEILAHYSAMGYSAGDVVSTGTVSGVAAFSADPKAWFLKPGDVMECEIEQIGVLRNPVISWEEAYGEKAPPMQEAAR